LSDSDVTEADLVGDLGDDPTATYAPPPPIPDPSAYVDPPPPWGDDPESWTPDMLLGIAQPPVPAGRNPNPWSPQMLARAQAAKRAEREQAAAAIAEQARAAERSAAMAAAAQAAALQHDRVLPERVTPIDSDDRSETVHRGFRIPRDADRSLREMAARDRCSLSAELVGCINFRERMLARGGPGTGRMWALVDDGVALPPGAFRIMVEMTSA
jgi:hypothetical protein